MFVYGLPYLLPELRRTFGLSLGEASLLITCPVIGVMLALIAWGAITDRHGERMVIAAGLVAAAAALGVQNTAQNIAASATPPVMAQLIQVAGYPASFGITALFPVAAAVAIPASAGSGLAPPDLEEPRHEKPVTR